MSATNSHTAKKKLTPPQRRMRDAVAYLQKYMATYDKQPLYMEYSDSTYIADILYGLYGDKAADGPTPPAACAGCRRSSVRSYPRTLRRTWCSGSRWISPSASFRN